MSFTPEITIISPVLNGLPHIEHAVRSVLDQSFQAYRWIISDNGSTDGTRGYLLDLQSLGDERIEIVFQESNLGIFGNLNYLCRNAPTELIMILCHDDYLTNSDTLSLLHAKWKTLGSSVGAARWNSTVLPFYKTSNMVEPAESQLIFFLYGCIAGNLSNMSIRKTAWLATGPFDQHLPFAGDYEYWSRLCLRFSLALFPEHAVSIRSHKMQASFQLNKRGELYDQISNVSNRLFARILSKDAFANIALRAAGTFVHETQFLRGLLWRALIGHPEKLISLIDSAKTKEYILSPWLRFLLFVATACGLIGKKTIISLAWKLNKPKSGKIS